MEVRSSLTSPRVGSCALGLLVATSLATVPAVSSAQGSQLPSTSQVQQLLQNPSLVSQLEQQLQASGMTPDQIRARLAASGYPPDLLDSYLGSGTSPQNAASPSQQE